MRKTIKDYKEENAELKKEYYCMKEKLSTTMRTAEKFEKEAKRNSGKIRDLEHNAVYNKSTLNGCLKSIGGLLAKIEFAKNIVTVESESKIVEKIIKELTRIRENLDEYYY